MFARLTARSHITVFVMFVIAVKFILSTLGYIAEVVVKGGGQENGVEDSVDDGEIIDSELQELIDNNENVSVFNFILNRMLFYTNFM